jgi:hypothetical protein
MDKIVSLRSALSERGFGQNVTDGEDQLDNQQKKRNNQDSQDQVL